MRHFKESSNCRKLNFGPNCISTSEFQQGDDQNKNHKIVEKMTKNRVNRITSPAAHDISSSRSPSVGILVVEYRQDEELLVKDNPSVVKSKNKCSSTPFATKVKQTASEDKNVIKSEAFKRLESKESRTCSRARKQKHGQHLVRPVSKHSRRYKRQQLEPAFEGHLIQKISIQSQNIQNKSAENLANQDSTTVQDKELKLGMSKRDKTLSKGLKSPRVQYSMTSFSNNSRYAKRHYSKHVLPQGEATSKKPIIEKSSIQSIQYKSAEDLADRYARIVKGLKLKESRKNKNSFSRIIQQKHPVVSSSKQAVKNNKHHQKNSFQRVGSTAQSEIENLIDKDQTLKNKYKSAKDLKTLNLNSQCTSNEYHSMEGLNMEDQNIATTPIAEITVQTILRSAFVNFITGFFESFYISIIFLFLDFILLNFMRLF